MGTGLSKNQAQRRRCRRNFVSKAAARWCLTRCGEVPGLLEMSLVHTLIGAPLLLSLTAATIKCLWPSLGGEGFAALSGSMWGKTSSALAVLLVGSAASPALMQNLVGADICRAVEVLPFMVRLNNGVEVPRIGFGTAGLGDTSEHAVAVALEAGYRSFDSAQAWEWYREDAVGRALRRATGASSCDATEQHGGETCNPDANPAPTLSREDLFVTTKIHPRDFAPDRLRELFDISRSNLNGVDLVLLHSPFCWPGVCPENPTPWQEAWRTLEELYAEGKVRAIGVSNFSDHLLRELLAMATVVPAIVQNWMDPFHQDREARSICAEKGIAYTAYSTLGGQWPYRSNPPSPNPVSTNPVLGAIAEAHGTTPQAVAYSWAMQSGALILPRSSNPQRIRDNWDIFFAVDAGECGEGRSTEEPTSGNNAGARQEKVALFLSQEDMEAIAALDGTLG